MYKVFLTRQVEKKVKKQGKKFKIHLQKILQDLSFNPHHPKATKLAGKLDFIHSYHFSYSGSSFRLAYIIDEDKKALTVLMVGPRENFYRILKQKL